MASSLFALLDDIASVLDDVAVMTKVAAKKTSGVLGDDLALNAQQVTGIAANRELPVVWAVAVGSLKNKAILVPAALLISTFLPWAVTPLLMLGGAYLCFEGVEKLAHKFLHKEEAEAEAHELHAAVKHPEMDMVAFEKDKIKGAIRTDFILSAEIIVIALGEVNAKPWTVELAVLVGLSILMTFGVYGFVALIVKMDDVGFYLVKRPSLLFQKIGQGLVALAPKMMKLLSVVGTLAMFLVGGGILVHGIAPLHHGVEHALEHQPTWLKVLAENAANLTTGLLTGAAVLLMWMFLKALRARVFARG